MRPRRRARCLAVIVALALSLGAGAAGAQSADPLAAAAREGAVTWYTVWPQWLVDQIGKAWAAAHPGVKLMSFRSGSSKVAAKVMQEREIGRILGDVVTLTEKSIFMQFKKDRVLEPWIAPEYEAFPPPFKDPDGAWATPRVVVALIWYNVPRLEAQKLPPPRSWADLLGPQYRGKTVFASPLYSGVMASIVGATVPHPQFGWKYWEALRQNGAHFVNDVPDVARAVAAGEREIGVTLWSYIEQYPLHPKGTIAVVVPNEGAVVVESSTGLLANRPHPNAGKLLQRFLLSAEVGRLISQQYNHSPRRDVPPPPGLLPLEQVPILAVDVEWLTKQQNEIRERWPQILR